MNKQNEWKWFGHPGHFICGRWCRFHLCTQVGNYLISTVGQLVHPRHSDGSEQREAAWLEKHPNGEEIGCGRTYETMAFLAGEPCKAKGCGCGLPTIDGSELDCDGYNNAASATKGHMAMCRKYANAMEARK